MDDCARTRPSADGGGLAALAEDNPMSGRYAWLESEALHSRALEGLREGDPARRGPLVERAHARYRIGRIQEAVSDLSEARKLAHAAGDLVAEAECLLDQATALDLAGQFMWSTDCVSMAASIAPEPHGRLLAARLALGRGRTLFRSSRWEEAVSVLGEAARTAAELGEEGYETRVVALLLLTTSFPYLGRVEEACAALDWVIALSTAHGDALHMSAAFTNGRNLRVAKRDLARAVEDQEHSVRIGRELGLPKIEYFGEYNLGELKYQAWRPAQALIHARRAAEIEAAHPEVVPHPLAVLLAARIHLRSGDLPTARDRLTAFRRAMAQTSSPLGPSESVLAEMVDLAIRESTDVEWNGLVARSRAVSVEQEPIEVLEARGLAELRAGQRGAAGESLREALALTLKIPNLMEERVREAVALASSA
jgi:eukaryotic-like serine/threonine-protein kinase